MATKITVTYKNDDYILVENMKLDIEELTSEDIYLALPGKILCKEDCKGLCFICGIDKNLQRIVYSFFNSFAFYFRIYQYEQRCFHRILGKNG